MAATYDPSDQTLDRKVILNMLWNHILRAIKNRHESLNMKEILRWKRNILKDVFCYNSFSLDFQLMNVTEYLLIQETYWSNFHLKKSKDVAVARPNKLKNA